MEIDFTSVPAPVGAESPPVRARSFITVSFNTSGAKVTQAWLRQSNFSSRCRHISVERLDSLAWEDLRNIIWNARVGVHFVFAGPQMDIYAARALALSEGAIDAEITLLETEIRDRRVYCAHCRGTTVTQEKIGTITTCSGCARELQIYHHFSRKSASYLGFMANAEEVT